MKRIDITATVSLTHVAMNLNIAVEGLEGALLSISKARTPRNNSFTIAVEGFKTGVSGNWLLSPEGDSLIFNRAQPRVIDYLITYSDWEMVVDGADYRHETLMEFSPLIQGLRVQGYTVELPAMPTGTQRLAPFTANETEELGA